MAGSETSRDGEFSAARCVAHQILAGVHRYLAVGEVSILGGEHEKTANTDPSCLILKMG